MPEHEKMIITIVRAIVGIVAIIAGVHQQVAVFIAFTDGFDDRFNALVAGAYFFLVIPLPGHVVVVTNVITQLALEIDAGNTGMRFPLQVRMDPGDIKQHRQSHPFRTHFCPQNHGRKSEK